RCLTRPWRKRLKLKWDCRGSQSTIDAMFDMHRQLATSSGGRPLAPFVWTLFKSLITPHPLGGCAMSPTADHGVVDHRCEVFGYPNLFVCDGSVILKAIGRNPSKTMAGISERTARLMLDEP